jgi:hypothetical protein
MTKHKSGKKNDIDRSKRISFFKLAAAPLLAILVKLVVSLNITEADGAIVGGWLGADGEGYINGVNGLIVQGYFSDKEVLSYWPAGYPILIWLLSMITITHVILLTSIVQTFIYGLACYFFAKALTQSGFNRYVPLISILLAFNPTLSLSSLVIGYESLVASILLILASLILNSRDETNSKKIIIYSISFGFFSALSVFVQPRYVLVSLAMATLWSFLYKDLKIKAIIISLSIVTTFIAPSILVHRNVQSIGQAVVSTNLGTTMKLGAGESTSGSYKHAGPEIQCTTSSTSSVATDNETVLCVMRWYLDNPTKSVRLFVSKVWFFWSPWSGPLSNGTTARNPWLKINPLIEIASNSQEGNDLVYKLPGKIISSIWVVTNLAFLILGYVFLIRRKGLYKYFGIIAMIPILISMLITMGTIGDHRFRIPIMPFSLFLQSVGLLTLKSKWNDFTQNRNPK